MISQDVMVDEVSACIDGFPKLGLASDHLNMNKFQSSQDNNYRLVSQEIRRLVDQSASSIQARLSCKYFLLTIQVHTMCLLIPSF
jgi:hypothetical protein